VSSDAFLDIVFAEMSLALAESFEKVAKAATAWMDSYNAQFKSDEIGAWENEGGACYDASC